MCITILKVIVKMVTKVLQTTARVYACTCKTDFLHRVVQKQIPVGQKT